MNMKKIKYLLIIFSIFVLSACSKIDTRTKISLVTDGERFENNNRSVQILEGLKNLGENFVVSNYSPSNANRYLKTVESEIKESSRLIVLNSPVRAQILENMASIYKEANFLVFDSVSDDSLSNVTSVLFKVNESAFLAGYLAGLETKTNSVGYIGLEPNLISDQYEFGFKAGLFTAAKELDKKIELKVRRVKRLDDQALGKELADKMYEEVDIIYQTVGLTGFGVIESAKNKGKFVIGYQSDQSYLAPENVLTSTTNNYTEIAKTLAQQVYISGQAKGNLFLGAKESAIGITPHSEDSLYSQETYNKVMYKLREIKDETIKVPLDEAGFEEFKNNY